MRENLEKLRRKISIDEDSDLFAIDESNRENEEPCEKYVGNDAFKNYYKKFKRYSVDPK